MYAYIPGQHVAAQAFVVLQQHYFFWDKATSISREQVVTLLHLCSLETNVQTQGSGVQIYSPNPNLWEMKLQSVRMNERLV